MPTLRIEPEGVEIEAEAGGTVLETALDAGFEMPFGCMSAKCGVCRIEVLAGAESGLAAASELERRVLEGFNAEPGVRLACQARLVGDVTVRSVFPRPD
jgi:ferredoxin